MLMIVSKYMLVMEVFFFEREVWETLVVMEEDWGKDLFLMLDDEGSFQSVRRFLGLPRTLRIENW